MKRVIALLMCLVLMVGILAACGDDTDGVCEHTYSETWSSDANHHWYDATCECTDAPITKLAHVDKNNDKICDICEFTDHTHTYAEGYTVDCTNHWNAADCGCTVAGANVAAHSDTNEDGKCDTCAYVIEDIHTHYYSTEWTTDESNHWHAALCEHGVEVADKAAHEIDAAGYCTVCNAKVAEVDLTNIEAVLAAAGASNHKVVSGQVDYVNTIPDIDVIQTHSQYYVLGKDSAYINRYQYGAATQKWLERDGENVFGVMTYDSGVTLEPVSADLNDLDGYYYMPSTIADASTLEGILSALYELSKADTAKDVLVEYDVEEGIYTFAYEYLSVNVTSGHDDLTQAGNDDDDTESTVSVATSLFQVFAMFTVDENYVIDQAMFGVGAYNQDIDGDYTYNVEEGTYVMSEGALADTYVYMVAQTSGERTYDTAYPKASIVPTDFDLYYYGNVVEDTLTVENGESVALSLGNLEPFSAMPEFIDPASFTISVANAADGTDTGWYTYYDTYSKTIKFNARAVGEYVLTVAYGDVTKTVALTVTPASPKTVTVHPVYTNSGWGSTWLEASEDNVANSVSIGVGEAWVFVPKVNPGAAPQGYTITVDSTDAAVTDCEITEAIIFGENVATYVAKQFVSNVDGTYVVTVTSTEDEEVYATVTVIVGNGGAAEAVGATLEYTTPGNFQNSAQTFTSVAASNYTITAEGLDASTWLQIDRYDAVNDTDWTRIESALPYTIYLEAGETLTIRLYGWSDSVAGTPVTVTVTPTEGSPEPGPEPEPEPEPEEIVLSVGSNPITVSQADIDNYSMTMSFVAENEGTYTFTLTGQDIYIYDANEAYVGWNSAVLAPGTYSIELNTYGLTAGEQTLDVSYKAMESLSATEPTELVAAEGETANYTFSAASTGSYTVTVSGEGEYAVYVSIYDAEGNYACSYAENGATVILTADTKYTVSFNTNNAGTYSITVDFAELKDLEAEKIAPMLANKQFELGDYTVYIYADYNNPGEYYFNIYNQDSSICNYYYFDVTSNGDGTFNLILEYVVADAWDETAGDVLELNGKTVALSYESGWVLTYDDFPEVGGNTGDISYDAVIVAGSNSVYFSADDITANEADRTLTVEADGNYTIACSDLFFKVCALDGTEITKNGDNTYTLTAGNYTVKFSMFSMLSVEADTAYTFTVTAPGSSEGGDTETV